jgi:hypothetical protein
VRLWLLEVDCERRSDDVRDTSALQLSVAVKDAGVAFVYEFVASEENVCLVEFESEPVGVPVRVAENIFEYDDDSVRGTLSVNGDRVALSEDDTLFEATAVCDNVAVPVRARESDKVADDESEWL